MNKTWLGDDHGSWPLSNFCSHPTNMGLVSSKPWGNSASTAQLNLDGAIDAEEFADAWTKGGFGFHNWQFGDKKGKQTKIKPKG